MAPITYLSFVVVVVVLPVTVLSVALAVTRRFHPAQLSGTALLAGVALVYTIPWDGQLIRVGVWTYGSTLVGRLGVVPYEELLFIVTQSILTGLWTALVDRPDGSGAVTRRQRALGVLAGGVVGIAGLTALSFPSGTYLGAILVWAAPVFGLQWAFGWPILVHRRRTVGLALAVPTASLWAVDRLAIGLGLWTFSPTHTTGIALLGLPLEEALFFLVTNAFLVQGLVLLGWVVEREAIPTVAEVVDRTVDRAK
ncbi:Lycopene beta-cyclase protein [Halorhabdus tiamatea SARL4B]|uniref:Geranylgeranyl-diphosphate geranylgeranyl-transferase n=1 Tax=Halorhabdus tiamatea SARL4B TaxID=1033806 RepID=F7PMY1_9EURY|nr:lycopene cyclase domain-containing protein [Halorhabdus tiamatea]ERJ07688.1 Lycopene beta-cyclase protein [Halorhabdus tiamatea SARL4B]CCQ32654.1 geranylgeranyl-diphosphate geranylgeranyl-transferase [Halorhabdus tiamatea SARL4B]